jgi:hypothetical protein
MRKSVLITLSAVVMLLMLFGCGDDTPPPYRVRCSIHGDGSQFTPCDYSLQVSALGKAFYVSDDLVFLLGETLAKQNLITGEVTQLSPSGMVVTDKKYLAIDRLNQQLYFAAENAIYRIGFNGQGLTRLSLVGNGSYSAPALSTCGQYLTAIRDSQISRMDINTLEWINLEETDTALYAIYADDEDVYYYYYIYNEPEYDDDYLCFSKLNPDNQEDTMLMCDINYAGQSFYSSLSLQVSEDSRYFAMQMVKEPRDEGYMLGPEWHRYPSTLRIYDRLAGQSFNIADSFCFAFAEDGNALLYSRLKYGMADLMRMDLPSRTSTMIWDGYYSNDYYSYAISEIFPRYDGEVIHFNAWERSRVKIEDSKSPTAPQ